MTWAEVLAGTAHGGAVAAPAREHGRQRAGGCLVAVAGHADDDDGADHGGEDQADATTGHQLAPARLAVVLRLQRSGALTGSALGGFAGLLVRRGHVDPFGCQAAGLEVMSVIRRQEYDARL